MLSRAKNIPSYDKWMGRNKSQELTDEELEARRVEHHSLVDSFAEYKAKKEQSA